MIPFRAALWIIRGCAIALLLMATALLLSGTHLMLAIGQCVGALILGIYGSESMWIDERESE